MSRLTDKQRAELDAWQREKAKHCTCNPELIDFIGTHIPPCDWCEKDAESRRVGRDPCFAFDQYTPPIVFCGRLYAHSDHLRGLSEWGECTCCIGCFGSVHNVTCAIVSPCLPCRGAEEHGLAHEPVYASDDTPAEAQPVQVNQDRPWSIGGGKRYRRSLRSSCADCEALQPPPLTDERVGQLFDELWKGPDAPTRRACLWLLLDEVKRTRSEETFGDAAERLAAITGEPVSHYELARAFGLEFDPEGPGALAEATHMGACGAPDCLGCFEEAPADCPHPGSGGYHSEDRLTGDGPCKWCGDEP